MTLVACDILIVGGGTGGVAAALAAAESGANVCLIEITDWLGGQLTAQGVCTPDENTHIETFSATRSYSRFREAVRAYYRANFRLTPQVAANPLLNPGNCWVSRLSFEPKVGVAILREMVRPLEESGRLRIFYRTHALACETDTEADDTITTVVAQRDGEEPIRFTPRFVLDATDLGDLLPLCGMEGADWMMGAESQADTGEPDAPSVARPDWIQPFTFPFALDWSPETIATNRIQPPPDYEALKAEQHYERILHGAITGIFTGAYPWWTYRRVLAAENFDDPRVPADLATINTGGNDYYSGNVIGPNAGDTEEQRETWLRARRASIGYLYWLQTECPREDDPTGTRRGYPELRLCRDIFDTPDGCAPMPYIRESRRILALRRILEQEIVVRDFRGNACRGERSRAAFMPDSVGIGHYALDIHPNGHGEPNAYVPTRPFQIPLGALIPLRLTNLLPAAKNLGTTHLTNGAYRLHPIEWNIGESAGLLAAFCLETSVTPREVAADVSLLRALQSRLLGHGIPLYWLVDVPPAHPAFVAVQKLAVAGVPVGSDADLFFRPDAPITPEEWRSWRDALPNAAPETFTRTRAEAALALADYA